MLENFSIGPDLRRIFNRNSDKCKNLSVGEALLIYHLCVQCGENAEVSERCRQVECANTCGEVNPSHVTANRVPHEFAQSERSARRDREQLEELHAGRVSADAVHETVLSRPDEFHLVLLLRIGAETGNLLFLFENRQPVRIYVSERDQLP